MRWGNVLRKENQDRRRSESRFHRSAWRARSATSGSWLYLVIPGDVVLRIGAAARPDLAGLSIGLLRLGGRTSLQSPPRKVPSIRDPWGGSRRKVPTKHRKHWLLGRVDSNHRLPDPGQVSEAWRSHGTSRGRSPRRSRSNPSLLGGCGELRSAVGHAVQSSTTFPHCPERTTLKASLKRPTGKRCVMTGVMSSPLWSITPMRYQVSNISRP